MPGQTECGDLAVVVSFDGGALAAAVDGLGHGPEAAKAARVAEQILRQSAGDPVDRLVRRCHDALLDTRGAVMTLARFDGRENSLSWVGVGNVEAILVRTDDGEGTSYQSMVPQGGIVGYRLPSLHPATLRAERGDTLILLTDGIRGGFAEPDELTGAPESVAHRIGSERRKGNDDALVLVARYLGEPP
jgi:hypothetical protein